MYSIAKKENRNSYIFHIFHSIVTKDSLKPSLHHKDSKYVLKVHINWWEGCFYKGLTHRTDKQTDRVSLVGLSSIAKKKKRNCCIFYIFQSIATKDSLKPSLCHKDSKSVLKVDMNWWEGCFYKGLTHRTDKQTDRQTFVNRDLLTEGKKNTEIEIFSIYIIQLPP